MARRLLFISGQIPQTREGQVPVAIEDQCRLVWSNVTATLRVGPPRAFSQQAECLHRGG